MTQAKKNKIFVGHYKSGDAMKPVTFPDQRTYDKWQVLCKKIAAKFPSDPYPYYEDYFKFMHP